MDSLFSFVFTFAGKAFASIRELAVATDGGAHFRLEQCRTKRITKL